MAPDSSSVALKTLEITVLSCSCCLRNFRIWSIRVWRCLWAGFTLQEIFKGSSRFFLAISRSVPLIRWFKICYDLIKSLKIEFTAPWSVSYCSSHAEKTSKHWYCSFSNSSFWMCIKRLVDKTLFIWSAKSREIASIKRRARWTGYSWQERIFFKWEKIEWTAARIFSTSVAANSSFSGKSFECF